MAAELFVSYSRKDRDQVLPWIQQLRTAGISVWMDEVNIDGAHHWPQEIFEAIQGCQVLLLMASSSSVASEHVVREVTLALQERKQILPLLLEPVEIPPALQYPLAGIQRLELFRGDSEEKFQAILRSLARLGIQVAATDETGSGSTAAREPSLRVAPRTDRPHNLPRQLTSFIGREREMGEVRRLLSTVPLLTLTGAGGCGKTRLALQVAADLLEEYPAGVWLVELAALAEPGLVPQQVATALGVREQPGHSLAETLCSFLQSKQLLLVLDNCEHLLQATAALAHALLRDCPKLRIVATSREALGIAGETVWRVPSLSLPAPIRGRVSRVEGQGSKGGSNRWDPPPSMRAARPSPLAPQPSALLQYEAVRLFIDRAAAVTSTFTVTHENAPAVAQVCHRLDGMPLAIELAAARVKMLSVEQIATRLDDRFRLLTGGNRMALPRQQTLRAAIDWSYELLSEAERVLLRRLSVFAGGFTLGAAEAVCAGEGVAEYEVLDLLGQLVDKSLLVMEEQGGEAWYRLLETIRQYGAEHLGASGEGADLRTRHRDWYVALAEQAEPELRGPAQAERLARLETEHDNLRAALAWSLSEGRRQKAEGSLDRSAGAQESAEIQAPLPTADCPLPSDAEAGLRLGGALWRFWRMRGHFTEGREHLAAALSLPEPGAGTAARAKALSGAGNLAQEQSDYAAARALHEESLAIKRELGDKLGIAASLDNLGLMARVQGDHAGARALLRESLAIFHELGDRNSIAAILEGLAAVEVAVGEAARAARLFGAAAALREAIGAPLAPSESADHERHVVAARAALGEEAFATAWAAGRAMTLEQAICVALEPV